MKRQQWQETREWIEKHDRRQVIACCRQIFFHFHLFHIPECSLFRAYCVEHVLSILMRWMRWSFVQNCFDSSKWFLQHFVRISISQRQCVSLLVLHFYCSDSSIDVKWRTNATHESLKFQKPFAPINSVVGVFEYDLLIFFLRFCFLSKAFKHHIDGLVARAYTHTRVSHVSHRKNEKKKKKITVIHRYVKYNTYKIKYIL